MRTTHKFSRGVSLVEAMVALAVMAFGMLAVVGVQSTLRLNADIAKQRTEATRIAQQKLDEWRSFTVIDTVPPAGQTAWTAIADDVSTVPGSNATYEVRREVVTSVDPPAKVIRVTVSWSDRAAADANDKNQRVTLASSIAAAARGCQARWRFVPARQRSARCDARSSAIRRSPYKRGTSARSSAFVPPWRSVYRDRIQQRHRRGDWGMQLSTSNVLQTTPSRSMKFSRARTSDGQLVSGFVRFQRLDRRCRPDRRRRGGSDRTGDGSAHAVST